ncbi:MAG: four helix bundle protein [Gemmatimonadaceae bacterium]
MASGIRELRVWQESVSLAGDVVRALRQGMRRETKCVSEAAMTTALAVGSHVADGYARPTSEEQREAYLGAKRALLRLETELAVARHAELIPAGVFGELTSRAALVSRLITGYLAFLDRQIADDAARPPLAPRTFVAPLSPDSGRAPG